MIDLATWPREADHFELDGQWENPGICVEMAGASNPRTWDTKKGAGLSGATITYSGDGLAKFSAKIRLVTSDDWQEWDDFKGILAPPDPKDKNPKALEIWHPVLEALPVPVRAVVVEDVTAPAQVDHGIWEIEIKFQQYRAPAPAGGGTPNGSGGKKDKTPDPVDQQIQQLTQQVNKLANG